MSARGYALLRWPVQFVRSQCVTETVLGRRVLGRSSGMVLAVTHLSHLEPPLVSTHTPRMIHWIARIEFFRRPLAAAALRCVGALPLNREGRSVRTIRRAIELARSGEIVGIFPEGGVARGQDTIFRGGPIKRGMCVIAIRAGVPIVPVVVLGTEKLNSIGPWLPARRARVHVAYGEPIFANPSLHRREARFEIGRRVQAESIRTYRTLLARTGIRDDEVP